MKVSTLMRVSTTNKDEYFDDVNKRIGWWWVLWWRWVQPIRMSNKRIRWRWVLWWGWVQPIRMSTLMTWINELD